MGQYWIVVNLDKREFVHPHPLGSGLKLWEQAANHPGTGEALVILCAAMPEPRGGGDFDLEENWHGPERTFPKHNVIPGPMPDDYQAIAHDTIGRWAGDRIALVGDYAEPDDIPGRDDAHLIYDLCVDLEDYDPEQGHYRDISDQVARVIEHELSGKYTGEGWRDWEPIKRN